MHAATRERHHHLTAVLAGYLGHRGVTVGYAHIARDALWDARSRTFTLRADADERRHLELIRDLIDMVTYGSPSQHGATPIRHLHAVAG